MRTIACWVCLSMAASAVGQEYRAEIIDSPAPADELSPEVAATLSPNGIRVLQGESRTVLELWPCKTWPVKADFEPGPEVLYPFEPGQLMGVLQFPRRGSDFRDQPISRGVYTLRYAQQPVDGNHVGTSPTRDFLLLLRAEDDQSTDKLDEDALNVASAEAAEASHPAMLALQLAEMGGEVALPSIRHDEDRDWWLLRFSSIAAGDEAAEVVVDVVVVGHAQE